MSESVAGDERGLGEGMALAVLVGMVVVTTVAIGMFTLVSDSGDEATSANFSFDHFSGDGSLLITHSGGEPVPADGIVVEGPDNSLTWAELGSVSEDTAVTTGDATQLSANNAYGSIVTIGDTVTVYEVVDGERIQRAQWSGE